MEAGTIKSMPNLLFAHPVCNVTRDVQTNITRLLIYKRELKNVMSLRPVLEIKGSQQRKRRESSEMNFELVPKGLKVQRQIKCTIGLTGISRNGQISLQTLSQTTQHVSNNNLIATVAGASQQRGSSSN